MATFRLTVEVNDRSRLPAILGEVADRIEATDPGRGVGGTLGDTGRTIGAYALVDDDEAWQRMMRRQLDEAVTTTPPEGDRG
jgi:hypothetical protein